MDKHEVKNHFSSQAGDYTNLMARLVFDYRKQNEIICQIIQHNENEKLKILDLGAGNGDVAKIVMQKFHNAHVTLFDITDEMLKAAEKNLAAFKNRFEFILGDYNERDIGKNYDVIITGLTLHHLDKLDREKFYHKIFKSLNNNGFYVSRDIIVHPDLKIREQHYSLWRDFMKQNGEDEHYWYDKHVEKDVPVMLFEIEQWLEQAGFTNYACHWQYYNFAITAADKIIH